MITIETEIAAPVETVWAMWSEPQHIQGWNFAGDDWHCPNSVVDLRNGGRFTSTMAARDGSFAFDFGGVYERVEQHVAIDVLNNYSEWAFNTLISEILKRYFCS